MPKYLPVPPKLKINDVLYRDHDMPVHVRLEQRIVWNLFLALKAKGFQPDKVFDGDEIIKTPTWKAAIEALFNLDDAHLYLKKGTHQFWIFFVFGNEIDVISDYSYHKPDHEGFCKVMDEFKPEEFA